MNRPNKILTWFLDQVAEIWRMAEVDKNKAMFSEVFKVPGNSGYAKVIGALERLTNVGYTKNGKQ
jgi:hypothetical protein